MSFRLLDFYDVFILLLIGIPIPLKWGMILLDVSSPFHLRVGIMFIPDEMSISEWLLFVTVLLV